MSAAQDFAHELAELREQLNILTRASQMGFSTVETDGGTVGIGDAVASSVDAAASLPMLADQAQTAQESADATAGITDGLDDDLAARFDEASADLDDARAQLDDAQQKLDDAFVEIGDLDSATAAAADAARAASDAASAAATTATSATQAAATAQTAADTANTAAANASKAALDASGLAASKGEVIVQVSAPTGSRANPANLWIDISGTPAKNTPNRYNTSTSKWEPVSDQKALDAAAAAASAATAAANAQSTADSAKANAAAAQTAASNAQSTADTAQQTAGTAASNAQAAIVSASAAQTTADTAKANASAAQTAADRAAAKAAATAAGVLTNGSAEFDFDSWDSSSKGTIVVQSTKVRSGTKAFSATTTGELRQGMFPVRPGDTWRYRWWAQAANTGTGSVNGGLRLQKYDQTASSPSWSDAGSSTAPVASVFTMQELVYTVPASGVTHLRARVAFANAAGVTVYFDDIELVNITDAKAAADAAAAAQSTADTAKANAATAQSSAAAAQAAADAAQATADTAKSNAATAQSAADAANSQALSAAGLAADKGKVIVQVSAPSGANADPRNLWIDITADANGKPKNTPNRYNASTSKWEPITDQKVIDAAAAATSAQSTADTAKANAATAQSAADAAKTAAQTAQTTANNAGQAAAAAQTTADTAKTNAATAQTQADTARTNAAAAQARADLAAFATFSSDRDAGKPNDWLRAIYPVTTPAGTVPSYALVLNSTPTASGYVDDGATLASGLGDNYVGLLRAIVRVAATKTFTVNMQHDDGGAIYVDGVAVYQRGTSSGAAVAISLTLTAGWHVVDLLWAEQAGGDGWTNISPAFASQVTEMYAPVSLQSRAADAASALTNASTAQAAADAAKTAAGTAQSTADTAKTNAATAQAAADAAKSAAAGAQSTADTAKANAATAQAAATAAQSTADTAKSNAATAQSAADGANSQALAAAGIANGKGKVIYQASAPTGSNASVNNLWIRTTDNVPFTYDATNAKWVQITDATATNAAAAAATAQSAAGTAKTAADNAATAASAAQQTANQAQTAAAQAQSTATGKPQILFGTGTPAGTAPQGSTWFQVDTAGSVIGQWQQTAASVTGSTWTARQMRSEVLANVDLGKLTAGTAAIVDAVIQKIAAQTANIQTANIANLFVTNGATLSSAVIEALYAQVVKAHKITADMIDAGVINVNQLNTSTFTANSFRIGGMVVSTDPSGTDTTGGEARISTLPQAILLYQAQYINSAYDKTKQNQAQIGNLDADADGALHLSASPWVAAGSSRPSYDLGIGDRDGEGAAQGGNRVWGAYTLSGMWTARLRVNGTASIDKLSLLTGPGKGIGYSSTANNDSPTMLLDLSTSTPKMDLGPGTVKATDFLKADGTSIAPTDTGWVNLVLRSGYVAHSGRTPQVRRKNGVTYMRGGVATSAGSSFATTAYQIAADLPSGFTAPGQNSYFIAFTGTGGASGTVSIEGTTVRLTPGGSGVGYIYLNNVIYMED